MITDIIVDKNGSDAPDQFMTRVNEKLGSWVLPRKLKDMGLENIPQYDPYKDETQSMESFPCLSKELEITPEV